MSCGAGRHRLLLHLRRACGAPRRGQAGRRCRRDRRGHIAAPVAHTASPMTATARRLYQIAVGTGGQPVARHPIHYASVTYFELTWGGGNDIKYRYTAANFYI